MFLEELFSLFSRNALSRPHWLNYLIESYHRNGLGVSVSFPGFMKRSKGFRHVYRKSTSILLLRNRSKRLDILCYVTVPSEPSFPCVFPTEKTFQHTGNPCNERYTIRGSHVTIISFGDHDRASFLTGFFPEII